MVNKQEDEERFELISQDPNGRLVIKAINKTLYISKMAHEVMANPELLQGFSKRQAAIIGFIAGMQTEQKRE